MSEKPSFGDGPKTTPAPTISAKRPAPAKISPVLFEGVRYEQFESPPGMTDQRTGYLAAYRENSDEQLWVLKIYDVTYVEHLERDVQETYFSAMNLNSDQRELLIDNERGERYSVNIDARKIIRLH